jgi:hypothetical protein
LVGGHRREGEAAQPEVLAVFDDGFDAGVVTAEGVQAGMVVSGQIGGGGLEPLAAFGLDVAGLLVVAGVQRFETGDDPHAAGRPSARVSRPVSSVTCAPGRSSPSGMIAADQPVAGIFTMFCRPVR